MGQNAQVMPKPLNSSIVIYSLEVHTIFSLFVLKKHMLGFAPIISVFLMGWRLPVSVWDTRYPEHIAVRRSVNGGLVHVCLVNPQAWQFLCETIKIRDCTAFLSKVKDKFVNNSGSN